MIQVVVGSLASQEVEGVVCPIRSDLTPLTAGARDVLHLAGARVGERLRQLGALPVGGAVITPGGGLGAAFIIYVVTTSEEESETSMSVQKALRNALRRAADWEMAALALPPLGAGVGHMEPEEAARAQVEILGNHLDEGRPPLELTIVAASEYEAEVFRRQVGDLSRDRASIRP